jgi:ATP-dependent 26S proteasome regulatory subunit
MTRRVLIIGTTNAPNLVDSALLRPGRFDRLIEIPYPSLADRCRLFETFRSSTPVSSSVENSSLAELTEGFSCAEIASFFRFSALNALREGAVEVERSHFDSSLVLIRDRRASLASVFKRK